EGIKGAEAITLAIHLNIQGHCWFISSIKKRITQTFGYNLSSRLKDLRTYIFDATCQGSVPQAFMVLADRHNDPEAAFCRDSFYRNILRAISLGGDTDTITCMAGAIAGALQSIPRKLKDFARSKLPNEMLDTIDTFKEKHLSHITY
ncbi:MAG: ADP-ribosylglycohydrolase family protein, partial [Syntrophorhabdaceae bacterium]|nr:ADP-ribosylglycohydrolase family protein [Syntrophorhabdaceae bacterium]